MALDRGDDAKRAVGKVLELRPDYTVEVGRLDIGRFVPWPELRDHYVGMLKQAGLPETPETPSRPVIAVLPFENMSGDPEQEYFAKAIAADISTAFTAFDLRVIPSQSAASSVDATADLTKVGSDLNADYLVTGTVRRSPTSIRLAIQLIEGGDGSQIWGKSFDIDADVSSVFEMTDEVTGLVTAQIASEFGAINVERISDLGNVPPGNMSSYDCYLRAVAYGMDFSPEDHSVARICLEKALQSDPNYAKGWALLAVLYNDDVLFGFDSVDDAPALALQAAHRSIELDPKSQISYQALALAHRANGDKDSFVTASLKAAELNPNDGSALAQIGTEIIWAGEHEKGKELLDRGIYLNPHNYPWINLGFADFLDEQGEYQEALAYSEKCLLEDPNNPGCLISRISLLGRMGRGSEAKASIEILKADWPDAAQNVGEFLTGTLMSEAKIQRYVEGMRAAGFTASDKIN
jgi:TolB-like protein/Tfp pilus assembly protein PilF